MEHIKLSVLIADDSPDIIKITRMAMELRGYNCFTASDGQQAIEFLLQQPVQLLITDMMMPKVDGIELILHAKKLYPEIKIVAMSAGYEMPDEMIEQRFATLQTSASLGADYLLKKPFEIDEFYVSVDTVMQARE